MMILGAGLVVGVLVAAAWIGLGLVMRGHILERHTISVDGRAISVQYRFGSKLPKLLKTSGTTINETVCFRAYPAKWHRAIVGVPNVSKHLVAHELGHVIDKARKGWWVYWREVVREIVMIRQHDDRMFERRAEAYAILLLAGKAEDVDVGTALDGFE